ncbi:helicase C-terminal domain-containing protein [Leptolyngbya sp. PCC 6406]|uniref:helicase C-terminal domain-containing protein n=1 Tax=Leptolyngbya sp. PCC 6406 TaxID=1173264 RepID=UPI0002ABA70E|nr:helicase C-terminal domain-containing protein [Leptolyngbya sp. PCC 6406]
MLEARVHEQLRAFLRQQGEAAWPHHLTVARLVARALRLGRSALMQVGGTAFYRGHYRLSYLMSLLMWPEPAVLVLPAPLRQQVQRVEIPRLQQWLPTHKPILWGETWPGADFRGLLLTSPEAWLDHWLQDDDRFPRHLPVVIDGVDDLEQWIRQCLTLTLGAEDWEALMLAYPQEQDGIRDVRVHLTHSLFQHPPNPYGCHLLESEVQWSKDRPRGPSHLRHLSQHLNALTATAMPAAWRKLWAHLDQPEQLLWGQPDRDRGQWTLHSAPVDVAPAVRQRWDRQPLVLLGGALDQESDAATYRQRLGVGAMTCLKFAPDRHNEVIQLYVPDRLPLPNTAQFQPALLGELARLLVQPDLQGGFTVVLVGDMPLKTQVGSALAAQFGSRVQVEVPALSAHNILVTGWEFWRQHQTHLPAPKLLAIATLPLPSLEDPLVAGRVAYYKRQRQDWFRLYLLPTALNELQRAIAPVRDRQGMVALLDNRVNYRSYGPQILEALSPAARVRHLDPTWLSPADCSHP